MSPGQESTCAKHTGRNVQPLLTCNINPLQISLPLTHTGSTTIEEVSFKSHPGWVSQPSGCEKALSRVSDTALS